MSVSQMSSTDVCSSGEYGVPLKGNGKFFEISEEVGVRAPVLPTTAVMQDMTNPSTCLNDSYLLPYPSCAAESFGGSPPLLSSTSPVPFLPDILGNREYTEFPHISGIRAPPPPPPPPPQYMNRKYINDNSHYHNQFKQPVYHGRNNVPIQFLLSDNKSSRVHNNDGIKIKPSVSLVESFGGNTSVSFVPNPSNEGSDKEFWTYLKCSEAAATSIKNTNSFQDIEPLSENTPGMGTSSFRKASASLPDILPLSGCVKGLCASSGEKLSLLNKSHFDTANHSQNIITPLFSNVIDILSDKEEKKITAAGDTSPEGLRLPVGNSAINPTIMNGTNKTYTSSPLISPPHTQTNAATKLFNDNKVENYNRQKSFIQIPQPPGISLTEISTSAPSETGRSRSDIDDHAKINKVYSSEEDCRFLPGPFSTMYSSPYEGAGSPFGSFSSASSASLPPLFENGNLLHNRPASNVMNMNNNTQTNGGIISLQQPVNSFISDTQKELFGLTSFLGNIENLHPNPRRTEHHPGTNHVHSSPLPGGFGIEPSNSLRKFPDSQNFRNDNYTREHSNLLDKPLLKLPEISINSNCCSSEGEDVKFSGTEKYEMCSLLKTLSYQLNLCKTLSLNSTGVSDPTIQSSPPTLNQQSQLDLSRVLTIDSQLNNISSTNQEQNNNNINNNNNLNSLSEVFRFLAEIVSGERSDIGPITDEDKQTLSRIALSLGQPPITPKWQGSTNTDQWESTPPSLGDERISMRTADSIQSTVGYPSPSDLSGSPFPGCDVWPTPQEDPFFSQLITQNHTPTHHQSHNSNRSPDNAALMTLAHKGLDVEALLGRCFEPRGPKPLMHILKILAHHNALTCNMLSSLILQFLPTVIQRVQKKVGKMNKHAETYESMLFLQRISPCLNRVLVAISGDPAVCRFVMPISAIVNHASLSRAGSLLVDFLRAFAELPFERQSRIMVAVSDTLLPIWFDLLSACTTSSLDDESAMEVNITEIIHPGSVCCHCFNTNILGPRFRCEDCVHYNLCGECFIDHYSFHSTGHTFQCLLRDVRNGLKSQQRTQPRVSRFPPESNSDKQILHSDNIAGIKHFPSSSVSQQQLMKFTEASPNRLSPTNSIMASCSSSNSVCRSDGMQCSARGNIMKNRHPHQRENNGSHHGSSYNLKLGAEVDSTEKLAYNTCKKPLPYDFSGLPHSHITSIPSNVSHYSPNALNFDFPFRPPEIQNTHNNEKRAPYFNTTFVTRRDMYNHSNTGMNSAQDKPHINHSNRSRNIISASPESAHITDTAQRHQLDAIPSHTRNNAGLMNLTSQTNQQKYDINEHHITTTITSMTK